MGGGRLACPFLRVLKVCARTAVAGVPRMRTTSRTGSSLRITLGVAMHPAMTTVLASCFPEYPCSAVQHRPAMRILISALILATSCATKPASGPAPRMFMRWTAASDRVELIPSDSANRAVTGVEATNLRPGESYVAPQATAMPFPPLPVPPSVRGAAIRVVFMINERGGIESVTMPALKDRAYTRAFMEAMRRVLFRPGRKFDGTPIRAQAVLQFDL
jgi:hypothetical protein